MGIGLVDYMVKSQIDPDTGEILPDFGVYNDEEGYYKKYKTNITELDALYILKANAPINTEAHSYLQTQMSSGKIKFLIEERDAKVKLMETKVGQNMTPEERAERLLPFQLTDNLREQMMNLIEDNEGVNIILKQNNRSIPKDRFSSLEYGMLYIKREEERKNKRKTRNISDLMFFT